ncbi:MAPEG family protein [uncultured Cohaesibacter sp.]|uniref:MAPEG family protein n=1 Tax=uncultured Cohaesibacter sp. TaxID=1002546 RepID=UPI0029C7F170|nr:MAPEG family protein [uncultured Cohaesibacter sp.]
MTTALYAGLLAFLFIGLSARVIRGRMLHAVALGDGGNDDLMRRIRSQANFVEYTPLFLILLALAEYQDLPAPAVHALGSLYLVGRISHAYGVGIKERIIKRRLYHRVYRFSGMICTFCAIGFTALILIAQYLAQVGG